MMPMAAHLIFAGELPPAIDAPLEALVISYPQCLFRPEGIVLDEAPGVVIEIGGTYTPMHCRQFHRLAHRSAAPMGDFLAFRLFNHAREAMRFSFRVDGTAVGCAAPDGSVGSGTVVFLKGPGGAR